MKRVGIETAKLVVNSYYRRNMSARIIVVQKQIDVQAQVVTIIPGDQPFIGSLTINRLIEEFSSRDKGMTIAAKYPYHPKLELLPKP